MAMSPTQLSLRELRRQGYRADVVEKWVPGANIRRDLFGIFDILAIGHGDTVAVQCTTLKNMRARVRKISESDAIGDVRDAGWTVLVHGWVKRNNRWVMQELDIS
jgi:hypothetical protein